MEVVRKVRRVAGQDTKWKLITVELGTNDVCSYNCGVRGFFKDTSPAAFKVGQVLAWVESLFNRNVCRGT